MIIQPEGILMLPNTFSNINLTLVLSEDNGGIIEAS